MENWSTYAHPAPVFAELAMACLGAGEFSGTNEGFRGRRLRSHAAIVVSDGSGWFTSPLTGEVSIDAPALVWLFPGAEHGYGPTRDGWTEHWTLFAGPATRAFDELAVWRRSTPVVQLAKTPEALSDTFSRLRADLPDSGSAGSLRASATCYSWIADLAVAAMPAAAPDLIDAFTRGCARQMSMEMRARELGVGIPELRAAILAATGLTPLQLLIESRLARAQALLAETDLEVGVIAERVGFDDPAYFSRQFTRRRGAPPSAFRREQRRAPAEPGDLP